MGLRIEQIHWRSSGALGRGIPETLQSDLARAQRLPYYLISTPSI